MRPKDFHILLTDIIDLVQDFPQTFWKMLVAPQAGFATALNSKIHPKILPGIFLFINLCIADLILRLSLSPNVFEETPGHIIGTLIFLFTLKLSFRAVKTTKLFTIICLSSIVYIPFAVVVLLINFMVMPSLINFMSFVLSGHYQTIAELIASLVPTCYTLVPLLCILMIVLIWWLWLISLGCRQLDDISAKKRFLQLGLSISGYIIILVVAFTIFTGSTAFSLIREHSNYEKMLKSFENKNYAEALFLASEVSNNNKVPATGRYRAYLIVAVSHIKTFWKNEDVFRDAIVALNAKKYREAELIIRKEVERRLLLPGSSMRFALKSAETALKDADRQYNSIGYSEAPTAVGLAISCQDIPINLFPNNHY